MGLGDCTLSLFSCYRRKALLGTRRAREVFLKILNEVRAKYDFALIGYVVMPEHIHLMMIELTIPAFPCRALDYTAPFQGLDCVACAWLRR